MSALRNDAVDTATLDIPIPEVPTAHPGARYRGFLSGKESPHATPESRTTGHNDTCPSQITGDVAGRDGDADDHQR